MKRVRVQQDGIRIEDETGRLISIPIFQLLQLKHGILLEEKGLRNSRGSVTAHVRRVFGFPRSVKRMELVNHLKDWQEQIHQLRVGSVPQPEEEKAS